MEIGGWQTAHRIVMLEGKSDLGVIVIYVALCPHNPRNFHNLSVSTMGESANKKFYIYKLSMGFI